LSRLSRQTRGQSRLSNGNGLENTVFERKSTPENKPSWNVLAKPNSINKNFNPEVPVLNEVELKLFNQ
jgi:hypothetical protein